MTAKQYLKQAHRLNELIESDYEELERLKQLSTSISSPNLSGMPSSGRKTEAPFVNCISKIIDLESYINSEIDRFVDLKKEIRKVIYTAQTTEQKLILKYRYMEFMKWEDIAAKMDLSMKQVYRIHNEALASVKYPYKEQSDS